MRSRLVVSVLLLGVVVLAGLLVLGRSSNVIIEQQVGPTSCSYDTRLASVVVNVPLSAKTRGTVSWEIQAQVYDRRDPSRQPYLATRVVSMNTGGGTEQQSVTLTIAMQRGEWLAGHNDCEVIVRSAHAS